MKITLQQYIMLLDILLDSLMVPDNAPIFKVGVQSRNDLLIKLHDLAREQTVEVELPGKDRVGALKSGLII